MSLMITFENLNKADIAEIRDLLNGETEEPSDNAS